ncbi:glycosyltransferase family 9 protein [Sphingomonas phyllosphaerae]|uniref:glycosyltransferase family 9 protein n=1 Tax=Sphingomonas phyllosphaerae TaxID=257003 RepID=UPI00241318C9|nr:glycosyltransferase family 9 protein [Sphingomonas phyllosphaerae]
MELHSSWAEAMRARDYAAAWALERQVIAARDPATRDDPSLPYHQRWVWDGSAVDGVDVLVRCYHGLGDTLQFARYLPALVRRARSVTVEAPVRLHALLAGIAEVSLHPFDPARPLKPSSCDIEITELPGALELAPDDGPACYLRVAPAPIPAFTVGLCHQAGDWDADRSLPEALLAPIAERHRCLSLVAAPSTLPVINADGCPFDLAATAALVAGCAAVVTVDTMVAHLAGALGRPTWLLLKHQPDWRWDPTRHDSDWYPTVRLHAQPRAGDWMPVLARVASELHAFFDDQGETNHGQFAQPVGARLLG